MRTVVVGASTGLGRCIGIGLAQRGANVALLARRLDLLESAAKEAGSDTLAIECDVTDEASCRSAIADAAAGLGGIDALVYAPGIGPLSRIADVDADTWQRVFATNVTGAAIVTSAALPALTASAGTAAYLSSVERVSHATLARARCLRGEQGRARQAGGGLARRAPAGRLHRVVVGDCGGGEGDAQSHFANGWDTELATEMATTWINRSFLSGSLIDVDHLVTVIDAVLRGGASLSIPSVTLAPRPVRRSGVSASQSTTAARA